MRLSLTLQRYVLTAVLPYFFFSWLLLSVVLFVQQASRFSDIFFSANIPTSLVWQLTLALVPTVISFTCPMAALVGVIIGLTKMQTDGELTAIRAAGASNIQVALPIIVLGVVLSAFAFLVNLYGVPLAAHLVRRIATQSAIYKLESPIEPGVFNTELAGFTVYVRDGDLTDGRWKNIFIYNEDPKAGVVRLITSESGRIDFSGELSELVLDRATVTTISGPADKQKFVSEAVGDIRYAVKTKRGELIQRLGSSDVTPEELGLGQLSDLAEMKEGSERTEVLLLWQRRLLLSITPLVFCLFGAGAVLRFRRQGRGFALLLALCSLVVYYLLAFLGEQLARTGQISTTLGGLIPLMSGIAATAAVFAAGRFGYSSLHIPDVGAKIRAVIGRLREGIPKTNFVKGLTGGLRDLDILEDLVRFYLLTSVFLAAVFAIFTGFELWKFAGTIDGGISLLVRYLFFLQPFIYLQLSPSATMIAALATFVVKSRQNELVTWLSAGQSVYRLLMPCLVFALVIGAFNFVIQETVLPSANQKQDDLKSLIRSRGVSKNMSGKYWSANGNRIFSFRAGAEPHSSTAGPDNISTASDNHTTAISHCFNPKLSDVTLFEFGKSAALQDVYRISCAEWKQGNVVLESGTRTTFQDGVQHSETLTRTEIPEPVNPFLALRTKPSHMSVSEAKIQRDAADSDVEKRIFAVAVEKKYSTVFLPLIVVLLTAPFAISLSRKGKVVSVGIAVAIWLVFMTVTSMFEQFGLAGSLEPRLAVWGPAAIFSLLGMLLISRAKT